MLGKGFVVQPTDIGLASPPCTGRHSRRNAGDLAKLSPLYWLLQLPELKPGGVGRASHAHSPDGRRLPVFCLQYVGAGKVRSTPPTRRGGGRYRVGDAYFARYWVQTIRYLCREARRRPAARSCLPPNAANMPRASRCGCSAIRRRATRSGRGRRRRSWWNCRAGGRSCLPITARRPAGGVFEGVLNRPAGRLSCLDCRARLEGSGPGDGFHRGSAGE